MAVLKKGARITGPDRVKVTADIKKAYNKGKSVRAIADDHGRSYGFVHRILGEADVKMRSRGGATRSKSGSKARSK